MKEIVRTDEEIAKKETQIMEIQNSIGTKYSGMTYEDGLRDMLDWLTDEDADEPLED